MSNRFATTGGTITGIIGIIGTTRVMVGTTPDLRLRERPWVSWERLRRVLRPATLSTLWLWGLVAQRGRAGSLR
jgi:hypothetical protein